MLKEILSKLLACIASLIVTTFLYGRSLQILKNYIPEVYAPFLKCLTAHKQFSIDFAPHSHTIYHLDHSHGTVQISCEHLCEKYNIGYIPQHLSESQNFPKMYVYERDPFVLHKTKQNLLLSTRNIHGHWYQPKYWS